jgi:hypothetical protein
MTRTAGLLCVLLSILCSPAHARYCWSPAPDMWPNQTYERQLLVVSGKACSFDPDPSMRGVRLIARPRSGRVVIQGQTVTYVARRGYLGKDHFVFVRDGVDESNRPVTFTVNMNVQVKEHL